MGGLFCLQIIRQLCYRTNLFIRVGGLLEFGRAHKTTYEFDYSEQFSIKNDLDLRPNELEISRSIWSTILLNY